MLTASSRSLYSPGELRKDLDMDDGNGTNQGSTDTLPPAPPAPPPADASSGADAISTGLAATAVIEEDGTRPNPTTSDEGMDDLREVLGAGVELDGSEHRLPTNLRLRAEELARRGEEKDPLGMIGPELIADAKERFANEAKAEEERLAAYDKQYPPLTGTKGDIEKIAAAEGVSYADGATKDEIIAAVEAARPPRA